MKEELKDLIYIWACSTGKLVKSEELEWGEENGFDDEAIDPSYWCQRVGRTRVYPNTALRPPDLGELQLIVEVGTVTPTYGPKTEHAFLVRGDCEPEDLDSTYDFLYDPETGRLDMLQVRYSAPEWYELLASTLVCPE